MLKSEEINLSSTDVKSTLMKLAFPAIMSQISTLVYNIADRFFVGKMADGTMAMAGIGVTLPIVMLVSAFSVLIGNGGAPLAAIKLGRKEDGVAAKILGNSITLLLIISIALTSILSVFINPLLLAFGAGDATIGFAQSYLQIYLMGTIFVQFTLGLIPFINTQGFTKISMVSIFIGTLTNLILDPILIFGFNMGVGGAALATIISQFVSLLWIMKFLFSEKSKIKMKPPHLRPDGKLVRQILSLGSAPFIMQATECIFLIALNTQLRKFGGDIAIATSTVMCSILQILQLPIVGMVQGGQSILSYNYGAKNYDLVKKTFKLLIKICTSFSFVFVTILMIFPQGFIKLFNSDPALVQMASGATRIFFSGQFIIGAQIVCQQTFISLGKAKQSIGIVLIRKVVILIPALYILPMIFTQNQFHAVIFAQPVADVISTIIAIVTFAYFYKKHLNSPLEAQV